MGNKKHFSPKLAARAAAIEAEVQAALASKKPSVERGKDKRADFVRLAEKRSEAVLDKIRLIGNLANSNDYDYTSDDVALIFDAILEEVAAAKARFKFNTHKVKRTKVKLALAS